MKRVRRRSRLSSASDQNKPKDRKRSHLLRVNFIYGMVFLSLGSLIARLGYLQISQGAELRTEAMNTSLQNVPVLPARGRIYDTNGNLLAYDQPTYSAYLTRIKHVNDKSSTQASMAALLAPEFKTSVSDVLQKMSVNPNDATVRLFANISYQQLAFISEHHSDLPGIDVEIDGQRKYPNGDLAGQVLGYVGPITDKNKHLYVDQKKYLLIQKVGEAGLESQYEQYLQGKVGEQVQQVNLISNVTRNVGFDPPPTAGDNLRLTLDGRLQAEAQNAVLQAIQQFQDQKQEQITVGAAVMMDVKTGGILAMVSYPYFDPNWYVNGDFTKHVHYLQTMGAQMNNVIQNPHYPGSTVKPANLITGLEHGVITPDTVYDDSTPSMWIGNYHIKEDAFYGLVNDVRAIAVSDDRFFYSLGLEIGRWLGSSPSSGGYPEGGNLQHWRNTSFIKGIMTLVQGEMRFGLGALTGIDLPGEQRGSFYIEDLSHDPSKTVTLDVNQVQKQLDATGSYKNYGSPVDLAFMAFGQSQQFTPIELLQYVSTIANNGKRLQPHLLQSVYPPSMNANFTNANEQPLMTFKPVVQADLKIPPQYLHIAQQGMYAACNEPDGTAYGTFYNAPYKAAGKTGTAEITMHGQLINNSVFIGYAPFDNPQVAVAVMVPGAGWGATTAVPIARQMMDDYFKEHHANFYPQNQWVDTSIPPDWLNSPAYKQPEEAK